MPRCKFKTILLLGTAMMLSACGDAENMADKMNETTSKMIEYTVAGQTDEDHLYLEEVLGDKALGEVKSWNKRSLDRLMADPRFSVMEAEALEILQSKDKIPYVSYRGGEVHNFWQDETHVRGIWRKTTLESYLTDSPAWETVLDYDQLSKDEGKNWVYKGNDCLAPDYNKCIISLSDGGKDAVVRREFNAGTKRFVEGGFEAKESKGSSDWLDEDTLLISVNFGEETMTDSGYPMISKLWKRDTPISKATEIYRGSKDDVSIGAGALDMGDDSREIIVYNSKTFYDREHFWVPRNGETLGQAVKIPVSDKTRVSGEFKGQIIALLNDDWGGYKSGDMVSFDFADFQSTGKIEKVLDFPKGGSLSIRNTNDKEDVAFISTESFLTPDTLWTYNTETGIKAKAKSLPDWFDASSMVSEQFFSTSTDGTKVPYFVVRQKDIQTL